MSDRRCGYCRQFNHTFPQCPNRLAEIDAIKRHIVGERRRVNQMLIDSGYGIGAIITAYDYRSGEMINCVITPSSFESIGHYNQFFENRPVKYEKRVKTYLFSFSGADHTGDVGHTCTRSLRTTVSFKATPLALGIEDCTVNVHVSTLVGHNNVEAVRVPSYAWMRYSEVMAPSNDGEVDMEMVYSNTRVNTRLTKGNGLLKLK